MDRQYNRAPSGGGAGSDFDFTPKYVWSPSGGGGGSKVSLLLSLFCHLL